MIWPFNLKKTSNTSELLRKALPLRPCGCGLIDNKIVGVWSNWDRLEVRSEQGKVLLSYTSKFGNLSQYNEFIVNRYLIVSTGDIVETGFKVYDFKLKKWVFEYDCGSTDIGFCGIDPFKPVICFNNKGMLEFWDISTLQVVNRLEFDADTVAINDQNLIAMSSDKTVIYNQGHQLISTSDSVMERLIWTASGKTLLGGCGSIKEWDMNLQELRLLGLAPHESKHIRLSPNEGFALITGDRVEHLEKSIWKSWGLLIDLKKGISVDLTGSCDGIFCPIEEDSVFIQNTVGITRLSLTWLFTQKSRVMVDTN